MNRSAFGLMAIVGLMAFSSCSSEMTEENLQNEQEKAVFTLSLPSALGTRADKYGDGIQATIDKIKYSVYKVEGEEGDETYTFIYDEVIDYTSMTFDSQMVSIPLMKNTDYQVVFAAYNNSGYNRGFIQFAKGELTLNYSKIKENYANSDMFVAKSARFRVDGGFEQDLTLKRPFAQLNWGASDVMEKTLDEYRDNMTVQVKIKADILCSKYNLMTGDKTPVEVEDEFVELPIFNLKDIPNASTVAFPVDNSAKPYNMIAMYYLMTPDEGAAGTVKMEFRGGLNDVDVTAENAPLYANCRTNIYGDLLTSPGIFGMSLDQSFVDGTEGNDVTDPTITDTPSQSGE